MKRKVALLPIKKFGSRYKIGMMTKAGYEKRINPPLSLIESDIVSTSNLEPVISYLIGRGKLLGNKYTTPSNRSVRSISKYDTSQGVEITYSLIKIPNNMKPEGMEWVDMSSSKYIPNVISNSLIAEAKLLFSIKDPK